MAQRKLKIALSCSLQTTPALVAMWVDNEQLEFGLNVTNEIGNPLINEYTFEATGTHTLKIAMINDYFDGIEDLNLYINYVVLSNEDGSYPENTYLSFTPAMNARTIDSQYLVSDTIWSSGGISQVEFNIFNPITWVDWYQQDIDHPPT